MSQHLLMFILGLAALTLGAELMVRGAARLALMAATGAGAEVATLPAIARVIEPDPALKDAFDAGHARHLLAQSAIKGLT